MDDTGVDLYKRERKSDTIKVEQNLGRITSEEVPSEKTGGNDYYYFYCYFYRYYCPL